MFIEFQAHPSDCHLQAPSGKSNRTRNSVIPSAIALYNTQAGVAALEGWCTHSLSKVRLEHEAFSTYSRTTVYAAYLKVWCIFLCCIYTNTVFSY